jgi:hypothetical protein
VAIQTPALSQLLPAPPRPEPAPIAKPSQSPTKQTLQLDSDETAQLDGDETAQDGGKSSPRNVNFFNTNKQQTTNDNPLNQLNNSLDVLIENKVNDDMWRSMLGKLPCLSVDEKCVAELQTLAIKNNITLKAIDERITAVEVRIDEATAANKSSINAGLITPLLQNFLQIQTSPTTGQETGILNRLAGLFTKPVGTLNTIFSLIGIPLFQRATGGSEAQQARTISIADLQVKIEAAKTERAKMANSLTNQVQMSVLDFDTVAREYQISSEIARREGTKLKIIEIGYRLGRGDTVQYLGQLSAMDSKKADTFRAWSKMRSAISKIKLMTLDSVVAEAEE